MPIPTDLSPESVQAWVEQLPSANKPLVAKETYALIQQLSEQPLPEKQLLQVLEAISAPADMVLKHISTRITASDIHAPKLLSLGEAFCRQLVSLSEPLALVGSKSALLALTQRAPRRALAVANYFLMAWQRLRAIDHRADPEGLWWRLKELNGPPMGRNGACLPQLIAFSLADTRRLNVRRIQELAAMLDALPMEKLVAIGRPGNQPKATSFFLPDGDSPPEYGPLPGRAVPVDLSKLVQHLKAKPPAGFDPLQLQDLIERWSGVRADKMTRTRNPEPIATAAVVGLHSVLRLLDERPPETAAPASANAFAADAGLFTQNQDTHEATVIDGSDGGCRLRTTHATIRTGDIIAIQSPENEWRIGSVAWILRDGDEHECGVQWLLEQPRVVTVRFDQGKEESALSGRNCLDGHSALLYATLDQRATSACLIRSNKAWNAYRLTVIKHTGLAELARTERTVQAAVRGSVPKGRPTREQPPEDDIWSAL